MPLKKYDWNKIKADFMASEFLEVTPFLKNYFGRTKVPDGSMKKNTFWWTVEKEEMQKIAQARARESTMKALEKMYRPSQKELGEMHKALINLMKAGIQAEVDECFDTKTGRVKNAPNTRVIKDLWSMVKVEKEEPTEIKGQTAIEDDDRKLIDEVIDENID